MDILPFLPKPNSQCAKTRFPLQEEPLRHGMIAQPAHFTLQDRAEQTNSGPQAPKHTRGLLLCLRCPRTPRTLDRQTSSSGWTPWRTTTTLTAQRVEVSPASPSHRQGVSLPSLAGTQQSPRTTQIHQRLHSPNHHYLPRTHRATNRTCPPRVSRTAWIFQQPTRFPLTSTFREHPFCRHPRR